jgi:hypothetical protein
LAGDRINSPEVWALVPVAEAAGEREVSEIVRTGVLLRHHVIHPESQAGPSLWKAAVLARVSGTLSHRPVSGRVHE